jgi:hypothetical protein
MLGRARLGPVLRLLPGPRLRWPCGFHACALYSHFSYTLVRYTLVYTLPCYGLHTQLLRLASPTWGRV